MKKYILSLDAGTTSSRAILFDKHANIISMAQHEISQIFPFSGFVEQNPMEIYANQYSALTECIAKSGIDASEIAGIGITNQRETVIAWNKKTGIPINNAIVWQCKRTAETCKNLQKAGFADYIKQTTGLKIDPYFSATKIKWILDNVNGAKKLAENGDLLVGTVDTWLIWKLTEGKLFITDITNASRTMLCNIHTGEWDDKLLSIFGIPKNILPEIKSSSEVYGHIECMGATIPLSGIAGDQQAALFGQGCFNKGEAKNTYGTGCFLLANVGEKPILSKNGLLTTVIANEKGKKLEYALEGSVFVGGAVIRWLRDQMNLIKESKESESYARQIESSDGVYFVPAFSGLGAPYWDMEAKGTIVGLTAGTGKNHIIRAALESIAYQTNDVISAMNEDLESFGEDKINCLKVDGGGSSNELLMQIQSDISNIKVLLSASTEATALGVAFLAGLAVGFYKSRDEIKQKIGYGKTFESKISAEQCKNMINGWHKAIKSAKAFGE